MVNKKYVAIIVIAVFFIIGILSLDFVLSTSKTPITSNGNMGNNGMNTSNGTGGSEATVIIQNGTFNPTNLTVKVGTTVIWIVKDNSDNKYMVTGSGFMSAHLTNGQSFSYIFNKTGTYDYYDMDHMNNKKLTGTVVVQ